MDNLSEYIGHKIKFYRKAKKLTMGDLSRLINKSIATIAKYENGTINIDILTLYEITSALGINIKQILDYPMINNDRIKKLPIKGLGHFTDNLFLYCYDGRTKRLLKNVLRISNNEELDSYDATLYMNVKNLNCPDECEYLYYGRFNPFDSVINIVLENQINPIDFLSIILINPMKNTTIMNGLIHGLSCNPLFPFSAKIIASTTVVTNEQLLLDQLLISKDQIKKMKELNMFTL